MPLEIEILVSASILKGSGSSSFHGFGIAQTLREHGSSRALTAHGTLYKALARLEALGLLTSHWEEKPQIDGRPRRRLYELTGEGARIASDAVGADMADRRLRREPTPA